MDWIKARWAEPSTRAGIAGVALALSQVTPPGSTLNSVALGFAMLFGGQAIVKKG
jgi:hypothetical protein